ncbi:MAG: prolyl oligopeptidase family serine peptidase, partial [Rhodospirillales bacterium]|nr:prolyl oligopeptidase family serine peptidase [Rhodospirillales bacterium]
AAKLFSMADYPIESVEIESEGKSYPGVFHRMKGDQPAPAVLFIPGMDMTKENYPNPLDNEFHHYGMHVLSLDGPGQGEALERGHYVTPTNHIGVARAAFEFLAARPEVDETRIGIAGRSFGTFWSLRAAADEPRFAAVGGAVGCYFWDRLTIFDEAPIRFKQVFMAMSGMTDEAEFDEVSEGYTLKGHADRIKCPVFMGIGEFDPLNPLEDAEAVYDALSGAKEMWVFEDQFHSVATNKCLMGRNAYNFIAEWMGRALNGKIPPSHDRKAFITVHGGGVYD